MCFFSERICTFADEILHIQLLIKNMRKIILTMSLALSALCASAQRQVYVCMGAYRYRYHYYRDCSGLNNCKATIVKMSESEAEKKPNINGLCKKCEKKSGFAQNEQSVADSLLVALYQEGKGTCYTCMQEMKVKLR